MFLQLNEAAAKKSGDDKKLQMVASRKKKLEDRLGVEKNEKGHRFTKNRCALTRHSFCTVSLFHKALIPTKRGCEASRHMEYYALLCNALIPS